MLLWRKNRIYATTRLRSDHLSRSWDQSDHLRNHTKWSTAISQAARRPPRRASINQHTPTSPISCRTSTPGSSRSLCHMHAVNLSHLSQLHESYTHSQSFKQRKALASKSSPPISTSETSSTPDTSQPLRDFSLFPAFNQLIRSWLLSPSHF